MKIAFLFLTIGELRCDRAWKQFFSEAPDSQYTIYHHAKFKDRISSRSVLSGHHISKHVATQWAHNSLVRATIALLEHAIQDEQNTFFVLVSESCLPLVPFACLYDFFQQSPPCSYFCFNPHYTTTKDCQKRYIRFQGKSWLSVDRFLKADQWFMLHREAAEFCATGRHIDDFERVFASDEHYFFTISAYYQFPYRNRWSTYCDHEWDRSHPLEWKELSHRFIQRLQREGFFFLRKVSSHVQWIS